MKKISILLIVGLTMSLLPDTAFGWGAKGHDVIASIAEAHLNARAKKEVQKLLGGHTLVYYATWMDDIRNDPAYAYTKTWHYADIDEGKTYETMDKQPEGDAVTAITLSIEQLKNKKLNDSIRSMYLKFLIHLVGDIHCPMHAGRVSDQGGNLYPIIWKKETTNLHRLWDGLLIDAAKSWTSIEWAQYIDVAMDKAQREKIETGAPVNWLEETAATAKDIYANTPQNQEIPRDYVRKYTPVIEEQFLKGGYRLAGLLNAIFK